MARKTNHIILIKHLKEQAEQTDAISQLNSLFAELGLQVFPIVLSYLPPQDTYLDSPFEDLKWCPKEKALVELFFKYL